MKDPREPQYSWPMERALEVWERFKGLKSDPAWLRRLYETLHAAQLGNLWKEYLERTSLADLNRRVAEELVAQVREGTLDLLSPAPSDLPLVELMLADDLRPLSKPTQPYISQWVYDQVAACANMDHFAEFAQTLVDRKLGELRDPRNTDLVRGHHAAALESLWTRWSRRTIAVSGPLLATEKELHREMMLWLRRHPDGIEEVAWEAFEKIIAEIFASHGFKVELTGRVSGRSADILAVRTDELGVDTRYLIEAKRYAAGGKVGLDVVNQVLGAARRQNVEHAFLVTTTRFTADVERERPLLADLRLHLRDGDAIREWLSRYKARTEGGIWLDPRLRHDGRG